MRTRTHPLRRAYQDACRHADQYASCHPTTVRVAMGRGGGRPPAIHVLGLWGHEDVEHAMRAAGRRFRVLAEFRC